jgi:O-antigen/teichoic acid export membrane protein
MRPSPLVLCLLAGAPVIPFMALAKLDGAALRALNQVVRGQIPVFLLKPLAMSVLLFVMIVGGLTLNPWNAMAINALTALAAWLLTRIWLKDLLPRAAHAVPVREGRRWFASMVPMALTDGMRMLQTQLSVLILGLLSTAGDVGLFRIAVSTAVVLMVPQAVIIPVVLPLISRLYVQKDMARLQLLLGRAAQVQFGGVLLLSLPLLIAPTPILSLVYGAEYAPAANVLRIVLLGQLISTAFGMNAAVLNMTKHERRVTRAMAAGLVLNATSIALLLPIWGITGAAVGFAMSMLAWNVLAWIDAWRLLGIDTSFVGIRRAPSG